MKRAAFLFLIFILVGWVFVPTAHAQFNPMPSSEEFGVIVDQKTTNGQMSKEVYTVNTQASYLNSATCMITGCSANKESGFYYGKSAIASISNVVIAIYANPPANLALWLHSTAQDLGFEPRQAYAQGIGFSGLSPLLPIWKAFRNIAYALLAVIMIVIGFMVMFRKKIDPKTVVTVQNALPKIVLALILVTFSYAIAAFFIDLMYLVMAVIINLLVGASSGKLGADTATKYLNGNIATLFGGLFGGGMKSIDDVMSLLFYSGDITPYLTWTLNFASFGMYALAQGALVAFIIAIVLIIGYIRIIFMLVSAYIQIIIAILVAPFQLMVEAFPGSNSFSSWLKNLIANLSVFPVTAAMILVGTILTKTNTGTMFSNADQLWTPPLLSSGGAKGVAGMIGLGLMLSIPNIAKAIKEALKTKPLVGGGGAGMGAVGGLAMQAFQVGSMAFSHKIQSQQVKATQDQAQAFRDYTGKKSPGGGE